MAFSDSNPTPSAEQVNQAHTNSDVDKSRLSQHHTLGTSATQASPGNHNHDGITSVKIKATDIEGDIPAANGLPPGGDAGQILAKDTATDYDAIWVDNYANWTSQLKHEVKLGEAISKGQAVYVSSADGTNMIVSKASNASEATSSKTIGLLESGGSTNAKVKVIAEGLLSGLNTSSATAGDPVWLGTSGNLIYGLASKPVAPAHLVFIGIVTRSNSSNGEIFVKPQNGFELNEIHDVLISSVATGEVLQRTASNLWENKTLAEAGIASTTHTHGNITNAGALATSVTATNPVKVVITNSSDTVGTLSTSGASGTTFLRGDGTWDAPSRGFVGSFQTTAASSSSTVPLGSLRVTASTPSLAALTVTGTGSQTQAIQIWENNAGGAGGYITSDGNGFIFNNIQSNNSMIAIANTTTTIPITTLGQASQTASLQEWGRLGEASARASVSSTGAITSAGLNLSSTTSPLTTNGSAGSSGQVLTSAGAGNSPTWATPVGLGYVGSFQTTAGSSSSAVSLAPATVSTTPANDISITGGATTNSTGNAGEVNITGGASTTGTGLSSGGNVIIRGGATNTTNGAGGNVTINGGQGSGANGNGSVTIGNTTTDSVTISPALTLSSGVSGRLNLIGTVSPLQANGSAGSSGQVLTSQGTGNTPTWAAPAAPTGAIMMWYTATPPSGWIFCQGQSTSGYPALAAVIGATVPDMRGRVPVAPDAGAGRNTTFNTLGEASGSTSNTHQHFTMMGNDGNIYIALTGTTVSGSTPASRVVSVNRSVIGGIGSGVAAMRQDATYDTTIDIRQPFLNINFIIKT
jgi:hypothetical protein